MEGNFSIKVGDKVVEFKLTLDLDNLRVGIPDSQAFNKSPYGSDASPASSHIGYDIEGLKVNDKLIDTQNKDKGKVTGHVFF